MHQQIERSCWCSMSAVGVKGRLDMKWMVAFVG